MCTILLRIDADGVIRLAANRDEFRTRPSAPPDLLVQGAFGGRDLLGGGTWLAVGRDRLAAVTNIRGLPLRDDMKTRGLLPLLALLGPMPDTYSEYNPFNLVVLSRDSREVITHLGGNEAASRVSLAPGDHVIVNEPFDRKPSPRRTKASALLAEYGPSFDALADHNDTPDVTPCKHGTSYGTVSSTSLTWLSGAGVSRYLFRDGLACEAPTQDLTAACRKAFTVVRWDAPRRHE